MSFSVSLDVSKLNEIIGSLKENRDQATKACAMYVLAESKKSRAYKNVSGNLRDNNAVSDTYADSGYYNVEYYQEYAPYVELGTSKMSPRPFLTPAAEKGREDLIRRLKEGLIK